MREREEERRGREVVEGEEEGGGRRRGGEARWREPPLNPCFEHSKMVVQYG
jgi:hypothetical protein